jgi:hypothetical protein
VVPTVTYSSQPGNNILNISFILSAAVVPTVTYSSQPGHNILNISFILSAAVVPTVTDISLNTNYSTYPSFSTCDDQDPKNNKKSYTERITIVFIE